MKQVIKGTVTKCYSDNAVMVNEGFGKTKIYSQYGGLDEPVKIDDVVSFSYNEKEKDGKVYNNIVAGSFVVDVVAKAPKDITSAYSQGENGKSSVKSDVGSSQNQGSLLDRDTLIVRQSCLKAAVEHFGSISDHYKEVFMTQLLNANEITLSKHITNLAEEFEKWVFR